MALIRRPTGRTMTVLLLVSGGCGANAPSPSLGPTPTASTPGSPAMATAAPTASVATPTSSAKQPLVDLSLDTHWVAAPTASHVISAVSLGDEIVWSGGKSEADNNLYRYVPGQADSELLFLNPHGDSYLTTLAGSTTGYVFTEDRLLDGEPRGWALWYLGAAAADPLLLDQSTDDRLPSPTIAMNDRYIAWEVVHGTWENRLNELLVAPADDPTAAVTLLSMPGSDSYIEFPRLWGDELWYGIVDNDWEAGTEHPRVELVDLKDRASAAQKFGEGQRAFMPAPGRDVVAWKSGGGDDLSAVNAGTLTIMWRATGAIETLPIPGPASAASRISYPSVGDRFVSWWDDIRQRFYLYDLAERRFRRVAEYDPAGDELILRPSLSASLLVYVHSKGKGDRRLEWALLPD